MDSFDVLDQLSSRMSYESLVCSAAKGLTQVSVHGHYNFSNSIELKVPPKVPFVLNEHYSNLPFLGKRKYPRIYHNLPGKVIMKRTSLK